MDWIFPICTQLVFFSERKRKEMTLLQKRQEFLGAFLNWRRSNRLWKRSFVQGPRRKFDARIASAVVFRGGDSGNVNP